ncbi:MAG: hypothetical protein KGL35_18580, partial [Bradyrhizobium sp.]|nr:hypothetical protein [Bradyrhizobium sp.]
ASFLKEGIIVVASSTACNIGDQVQYNLTTGAIATAAPGAAVTAGYAFIANAAVERYVNAAAGLIAIHLNSN